MPAANRDAFGFPVPSESLPADDPLLQPTISKAGRENFRAAEIKKVVDQGQPVSDSERPILWMMGGGSGVGKSTVLDTLRAEGSIPTEHVVHIDPDAFKEVIPEFRELVKRKESRAAAVVHEESTLMAGEAFRQAISRRTDIIYDTTLSNFARARAMITEARANGYEIRIVAVTAAPRTAVQRVVSRGDRTGRYVPVKQLLATHKQFSRAFERYIELVESITLWKTDCGDGTLKKSHTKPKGTLTSSPAPSMLNSGRPRTSMKTLPRRTKSTAPAKIKNVWWKLAAKVAKPLKSQRFPEPPDTLDATEIIKRNQESERRSKLPVVVYFPPNE